VGGRVVVATHHALDETGAKVLRLGAGAAA
jgi:hypothetical protein